MYPRPEEFIGQEVDGHRVDAVLGRGGMGIVFKAENLELSRTVALKIINPALAQDESFLRRFRAEARALAQIHHPNIVIVYDFRQFDMGFYISMEYVEGPTLADYLEKEGPVPWKEGLTLTKQMLSAFHYAHSCGVIHRDIKPRNILLAKNNVVKITDFGLAKILQEGKHTSDTTLTMATGGTIHYMPPEQIRGLRNVDHRGDIFSLGMTIYEAIAGVLPFDKNSSGYTIQKMIVEEPFPDIRKLEPSIPKALARIIMKSLEKEPHRRYQSAAEMISALEEFELNYNKTALVVNGSIKQPVPPSSFGKRWKIYAALVGLFVVAVSFLTVFMPERLGGFIEGSGEEPTLAEQVLENPPPSTPQISNTETIPLGDIGVNPINIDDPDSLELAISSSANGTDSTAETGDSSVSSQQGDAGSSSDTEVGSISFTTLPKGAEVFLNGISIGSTPLFVDNVQAGSADIELRLADHRIYTEEVSVQPYQVSNVNVDLEPITGLLKLDITPASELYIDDRLVQRNASGEIRLPLLASSHRVLVSNTEYGQWAKNIDIAASDSVELAVDFTQKINLIVTAFDTADNGMYAEIVLDGKPTNSYTPGRIEIPVGLHTIEVRADGYELVEEPEEINYEGPLDNPLRLILRKTD